MYNDEYIFKLNLISHYLLYLQIIVLILKYLHIY
jgi:hypothetical protein